MIPKQNLKRNLRITLLLFVFPLSFLLAQQTASYTNKRVEYNKAVELYKNHQFLAAQLLFYKVKNSTDNSMIKGDCAYYIASASVRLNQKEADRLMEDFVTQYPAHIKRNSAYKEVADFYFKNGKYARARKWYNKVDETGLSPQSREEFYFNNAYSFFKTKRFTEAKKYFNRIINSKTYGSQAKYYLGYIAYQKDDYKEANELFEEVKNDTQYGKELSYYQADMNFKLGNFEKAITLGKEQFNNSNPTEKSELAKIIGESYFNIENYAEAIPYLKQYKGKKGKWNNTDYYQLGYAYYKQGDYENAINRFNKIIDGNNSVAQNAFYHLAHSYLKLNQKQQALNAFKNASEMDFSPEIQEDAHFNYAKLSYEIGNSYKSVPEVILDFIKTYPKNKNNEQLKGLLIDSYITSKNYKAAMNLLENNKSFRNKVAYQKVAFYRGLELFNQSDYKEAKIMFDKSLQEPQDNTLVARATYWKAESDYRLSDYKEALIGFKQFLQFTEAAQTPEYKNIQYHLGYTYFKQKNYPEALNAFLNYTAKPELPKNLKADALLRLGDAYFISGNYWKALENYNAAIKNNMRDTDYAAFQKLICYGFVNKISKKIEGLKVFGTQYPKSIYRDDALYELGNTYLSQNKLTKALETYNTLLTSLPQSSYVPKTMLKKALILDTKQKPDQALAVFKRVASKFPGSQEALQAVASAKLIYIDQGRVDDYAAWIQTLDFVSIEDTELDDATYKAAEQPYLENNTKLAQTRLENYLDKFPSGQHAIQANFYLAQVYFNANQPQKALTHFQNVVKTRNQFTEQALARLSELLLQQEDYAAAIPYLTQLETLSQSSQNTIFAQSNLMKSHYELEQYFEASQYAQKVLENNKIDSAVKSDAQIIIARSAMQMGDNQKAEDAYREVLKIATGKRAAEALFYDAYFKNRNGAFTQSNEAIQTLAKEYSAYKYWGAKGLVLMAKNFYALKDAYQATYILESVSKNFTQFQDVTEEAQALLTTIKKEESKTNDSIEVEDEN